MVFKYRRGTGLMVREKAGKEKRGMKESQWMNAKLKV